MFKPVLSASLCLIFVASGFADNTPPEVTNVAAMQQGECGEVAITYDLDDADGDACTVWVAVSEDGGASFNVPVLTISGDFGEGIPIGTDKMIIWDIVQDAPGIEGSDFVVRVYADDGNGTGPMVYVPPGSFQMGQTGVAEPVHAVTLSGFWIDKVEVSNSLYAQFLNAGGNDDHWHASQEIIRTSDGQGGYIYSLVEGREQFPVVYVNYDDATDCCEWRGIAEGGTFALTTAAQWECAAAWDPLNQKHWTYAYQSDALLGTSANYYQSGDPWDNGPSPPTTPVGFYDGTVWQQSDWNWPGPQETYATSDAESFYGARDMTGNIEEWCFDWYSSTYYQDYINSGSPPDPMGPPSGSRRVHRGGYYQINADTNPGLMTANREDQPPASRTSTRGFRCVRLSP